MKSVSKEEVEKYFCERKNSSPINESVFQDIKNCNNLYLFDIDDEATFMSLIWMENNDVRILTPGGKQRTLADIVKRMGECDYNLATLSEDPRKYQNESYDPGWFSACLKIDKEFDFNEFGWLVLALPKESEQKQSPNGTFYIYDGVHRALVLARKLFQGEIKYQKIKALLIIPRL